MVYKILRGHEWQALRAGPWEGSAHDRRDGFIHLSARGALEATLRKHFAGERALILAAFDEADLAPHLRTEPARSGALFPHLYAPLEPAFVKAHWALREADDGEAVLPEGLPE